MTTPDRALRRGVFLGGVMVFGAGIAGEAVHWFITTSLRPAATTGRHIAVLMEGILGAGLLLWGLASMKRETRALRLAAAMKEASRESNRSSELEHHSKDD